MLCCFAAASVLPGVMATEDFQFTFKTQGLTSTLSVPLRLPLNQSVEELSECLMKEHNLPCFVEKGIELDQYSDSCLQWTPMHNRNSDHTIEVSFIIESFTLR